MVQAFLIYFGLPNLGITFSAMTAGVLSMSFDFDDPGGICTVCNGRY